jgi:hypothetical protein
MNIKKKDKNRGKRITFSLCCTGKTVILPPSTSKNRKENSQDDLYL